MTPPEYAIAGDITPKSTPIDPAIEAVRKFEKRRRDGLLRCHLCVYFDQIAEIGETGICRFNPPPHPTVDKSGWCGQFQGRV